MPAQSPRRALVSMVLCGAACAQAAPLGSGVDLAGFDRKLTPRQDLFDAVNGHWLATTEIPADKSSWGNLGLLRERSDQRVRGIVEKLAAAPQPPGSLEAQIAVFYRSYLDTAAIDKAGLAPLQAALAEIDGLRNRSELAAWMGRHQRRVGMPIELWVSPDAREPGINRANTDQAGLGLPDRDYYLKDDDARLLKARAAYQTYLTTLGTLLGDKDAAATARQVLALERRIAEAHWPRAELRDPVKTYNPMTPAELAERAPGFDWAAYLAAADLGGIDRLSVSQPSVAVAFGQLMAGVPLEQWRAYCRLQLVDAATAVLPQPFRDAAFAFHGKALSGALTEQPRWQQGIAAIDGALGEAVGRLYVAEYFPPAAKARMQQLVANLLATFGESIDQLTWMSAETKDQARAKLSKYGSKIGYPERWRDYSRLVVKPDDAWGNRQRSAAFEWQRVAERAGQPVDRSLWLMRPQTVNAYYDPSANEIVFPAAILQPPFFDAAADDAVNYGAIGAVIGHEISHGFDDQGSQFDGDGRLRNWWTEADRKAFDAIGARLVSQYEGYEPIPGKHLDGRLTLGENIADLSGLQIAYKAYRRSLGGKEATAIDGYSGDQRFFLGWSQIWRVKDRPERALQLLSTDPHSPGRYRANGAAINADGFHRSFGTQPGDAMYKPEAERIRIW